MDKKSERRTQRRKEYLKNKKRKKIISFSVAAAIILIAATLFTVKLCLNNSLLSQLCDYSWVSVSAKDASGDEVELGEIYQTNATSYRGSLNFTEEYTFSLWLSPGAPDDGTHGGKYEIASSERLDVTFDEGTSTSFELVYEDGELVRIVVKYQDYDVAFEKQ